LHDAYKHLKTLGVDKEVPVTTLKDSEGNVLTDPEAVHGAWKEFSFVEDIYQQGFTRICQSVRQTLISWWKCLPFA
jgi:hypothetical protein